MNMNIVLLQLKIDSNIVYIGFAYRCDIIIFVFNSWRAHWLLYRWKIPTYYKTSEIYNNHWSSNQNFETERTDTG